MEAINIFKDREIKEKDGDDDFVSIESIVIKKVTNGWMIVTVFEDDSESTEVFDLDGNDNGNLQAVKCILESMGLEKEIKIK